MMTTIDLQPVSPLQKGFSMQLQGVYRLCHQQAESEATLSQRCISILRLELRKKLFTTAISKQNENRLIGMEKMAG